MAKIDPTLGVDEKGILQGALGAAGDVVDYLGSKGASAAKFIEEEGQELIGDAIDTASDIGGAISQGIGDLGTSIVESPIGDFFTEDEPLKYEESKQINKQYLEDAASLSGDSFFDTLGDLWDGITGVARYYTDADIKDRESFQGLQELEKNYYDQVLPIIKQIEDLTQEGSVDTEEYKNLVAKQLQLDKDYGEQRINLVNKAIKGTDYVDKTKKLDSIYTRLSPEGEVTNEAKLRQSYSKDSDDFIEKQSRLFGEFKGFEDPEVVGSITRLKTDLAGKLTNLKVNRTKAVEELQKSGAEQYLANKVIGEYNESIALYEDLVTYTLEAAYAGKVGSEIPKILTGRMGEENVKRLVELDNNLTADMSLVVGSSNLVHGNPFSGIIQLLGAGASSKGVTLAKEGIEGLLGTDTERKVEKDLGEAVRFDKSGGDRYLAWTLANFDDLALNTVGIVGTSLGTLGAFNAIGKLAKSTSYTKSAIARLDKLKETNKAYAYLMNDKKLLSIPKAYNNVVTGLLPNAMINTAAGDVTSESRILFDAVMDVALGPIFDGLTDKVGGGVRSLTKSVDSFGGVSRDTLVKKLGDNLGLTTKDADEVYDSVLNYLQATGKDLATDREKIDFATDMLSRMKEDGTGVAFKDGIIARLEKETQMANKFDTGLANNISESLTKNPTKPIDLSKVSFEKNNVDRLFKKIETLNFTSSDIMVNGILENLGVSKLDIKNNTSDTTAIVSRIFAIGKEAADDIKAIKERGVLTIDDAAAIANIQKFQTTIDELASKYNKDRQVVLLYDKDGVVNEFKVDDITTDKLRMRDSNNEMLFATNSTHAKLKNLEFEGYTFASQNFVRQGGGSIDGEGAELANQLNEISDLIYTITGWKPEVINKSDIPTYNKQPIVLYKDDDGYFKISVGGKHTTDMTYSNKEIQIETSGNKFDEEYRKRQRIKKYENKDDPIPKQQATGGKYTPQAASNTSGNKLILQTVKLDRSGIQEGPINRSMWNRILLADKNFTADKFDDIIGSEVVNLKKIISNNDDTLYNGLSLKDNADARRYVIGLLKKDLKNSFTEKGQLENFISLLEETVFSDESLNLLAKFSRKIGPGQTDKIQVLANVMHGLGLHSAYRYDSLKLNNQVLDILAKYSDRRKAKIAIGDILLGKDPVNSIKFIPGKTQKQVLLKIQEATGINIHNKLLKQTEKGINNFLESLMISKRAEGKVNDENYGIELDRVTSKMVSRVLNARDTYVHSVFNELYKGDSGPHSILNAIRDSLIPESKITETERDAAEEFLKKINAAEDYNVFQNVLIEHKGIKVPQSVGDQVLDKQEKLLEDMIAKTDMQLGDTIAIADEVYKTLDKNKDLYINEDKTYNTFYESGLYAGDNIVSKSLQVIMNPFSKVGEEYYDDGISKVLSDSINKNLLGREGGNNFYQIAKTIRNKESTPDEIETATELLKDLQEELFTKVNPKGDYQGDKFSLSMITESRKVNNNRDKALTKIWNDVKNHIENDTPVEGKYSKDYRVYDDNGKPLTQKQITQKAFSAKAKLKNGKAFLSTLQNRLKYKQFDGYRLNTGTKEVGEHKSFYEEKTLFNVINDIKSSEKGVKFIPMIIDGGNQLYNFVGGTRGSHRIANNRFKYLIDNPNAEDYNKVLKDFERDIAKDMADIGYLNIDVGNKLNFIGEKLGLSKDIYQLALNIGDKDGIGIGFKYDGKHEKFEDIWKTTLKSFGKDFKKYYKFGEATEQSLLLIDVNKKALEKDKQGKVISKRISPLSHEDASMTPNNDDIKKFNYYAQELKTIESMLMAKKVDGKYVEAGMIVKKGEKEEDVRIFAQEEEDRIRDILKSVDGGFKKVVEINDVETKVDYIIGTDGTEYINDGSEQFKEELFLIKEELIYRYINNEKTDSKSMEAIDGGDYTDKINNQYNFLTTSNTDGASHIHKAQLEFISQYQSYIEPNAKGDFVNPMKAHESNLGSMLNKTEWFPMDDTMVNSLSKEFFPNGKNSNGYTIESSSIVGMESAKLGQGNINYLKGDNIKYVEDSTGVVRKIVGWNESTMSNYHPASEEIYIDDVDITGVTKQVLAQNNGVGKIYQNSYELFKLEELYSKIRNDLTLDAEIPVGERGDSSKFLNSLKNSIEIANLSDTKRAYIKSEYQKLLSYIEKPKEDNLGFRNVFIPRSMIVNSKGKRIPAKDDTVYVSEERFNDMVEKGHGYQHTYADGTSEYYVVTFRSPVANAQNATMQKIAIDKTIDSMDTVAVSPYQANVLKQADYDGDHLNVTFISKGVHAGGVSTALSFITMNPDIDQVLKEKIIKTMYNDEIDFATKERLAFSFLSEFLETNRDYVIPSVGVKQVVVGEAKNRIAMEGDLEHLADQVLGLKDSKNNTVRLGKDLYYVIDELNLKGEKKSDNEILDEIADKKKELKELYKKKIADAKVTQVKALQDEREVALNNIGKESDIKELIKSKIQKLKDNGSEGEALILANDDAIIGKDGISLVSADTRTYTWLRTLAWEWANKNLTGMTSDKLAKKLSLNKESDEFNELVSIFEDLDSNGKLNSKEYDSESATINQLTVDAAKTGTLPKNWKSQLQSFALGVNIEAGSALDYYITNISKSYNKVYDLSDGIDKYFKSYDNIARDIINDELRDFGGKKIIGNNALVRDKIRDQLENLSGELIKGTDSMKHWMAEVDGSDIAAAYLKTPKDEFLEKALMASLKEEDQWLVGLLLRDQAPVTMSKPLNPKKDLKRFNVKTKSSGGKKESIIKKLTNSIFKEGQKSTPKIKKEEARIKAVNQFNKEYIRTYNAKETRVDGVDEQLYKELGLVKMHTFGRNLMKGNVNKKGWRDNVAGEYYTIGKDRKLKDKILEYTVTKLRDGKTADTLSQQDIFFNKDEITKLLYGRSSSKRIEDYLKKIMAQIIFNKQITGELTDVTKKDMILNNVTDFLIENVESGKMPAKIKEKFGAILSKLPTGLQAKRIKAEDNMVIVYADDTSTVIPGKYNVEGKDFTLSVDGDGKISITDDDEINILEGSFEISDKPMSVNEYKSSPLEQDLDMLDTIGITTRELRGYEAKLDNHMRDVSASASVVNSKLGQKYFEPEMIRTEDIAAAIPQGAYDELSAIKKAYEDIPLNTRREIDNAIYYEHVGLAKEDPFSAFQTGRSKEYLEAVQTLYKVRLKDAVSSKRIRIKPNYNRGSIIEDLVGLEISKTEKIAFLEQGRWTRKKFDELAKTRMGDDYKEPITKGGVTKYGRRVNDLYGGFFERNIFEEGWQKMLRPIRNTAYQVIYGWMSWFTSLGGLIVGASQIPVEFLRIQSLTNKLKSFNNHDAEKILINKYGILKNVGIETAIRVGPQEVNAPYAQKKIFEILENFGTVGALNSKPWYLSLARKIAAFGYNPMIITDLVLDGARKKGAMSDTLYLMGFDSTEKFIRHIDGLDKVSRDRLLSKVRLQAKQTYNEISGGVTAGSYLYRESFLSRRLLPFNFLMGWGNRLAASVFEDVTILTKGFRELTKGNYERGYDLMFNKSKAIDKFVSTSIMTIAMYSKVHAHDDYEGEFAKRKSLYEWVKAMNSNFIAVGMSLPYKVYKEGIANTDSLETRMFNTVNQLAGDVFRELDVFEILTENMGDWLQGDREDILDAVVEAINTRAMKGLAYNKVTKFESLYSDFRDREDMSNLMGLDIKSEDEEKFYNLSGEASKLRIEALLEDGKHHLVVLEAIKALPLVGLMVDENNVGSYQSYLTKNRKFVKYLSSDEFNETFLDIDKTISMLQKGGQEENLYKSLTTFINSDGLDEELKATLKNSIAQLNEDMLVDVLKKKHGDDYAKILRGEVDSVNEYITSAITEKQAETNQLLMKIQSESPAAAPYILAQIMSQELYEFEKSFEKERGIYGIDYAITNEEKNNFILGLVKTYEPLIRASASTESTMALYTAIGAQPEFMDSIVNASGYIQDTILDRTTMQLAVSKSIQRGETNPGYLTTRLGGLTNKLERDLVNGNISETIFKSKVIDLYNYGLDQLNNSTLSVDQKVEMKATMLKSLGEYGYVLNADPLLAKGFDKARVALMHKLHDNIIDLKPYATQAKLDLAEASGRITKGTSIGVGSRKSYGSGSGGGGMAQQIPQMRQMLTNPKNGWAKEFTPGQSGYNPNSLIKPLATTIVGRGLGITQYRTFLGNLRSGDIIKPIKKYKPKPEYIRVGKAESIKQTVEKRLKVIYSKRSKGLIPDLPYKR